MAEDVAWLIFSYVGAEIEQRMIPWSRLKRGDFASVSSRLTASLIFEVDQISLQLKCQICRARSRSPVYNVLFHSSLIRDIWHHDMSHASHPLSPVTGAHRYREHESENKPLSRLPTIHLALAQSARNSELTEPCAKKLNTNPVHRTQNSDRGR